MIRQWLTLAATGVLFGAGVVLGVALAFTALAWLI